MKSRNNLDEMQEQKLLKIESKGFWFAYWGMLAGIVVKQFVLEAASSAIMLDWILFMSLSIYIVAACMRNGIWSRTLANNWKTNLLVSVVAGLAAGLVIGLGSFFRYRAGQGSLAAGLITAAITWAMCFIALQATGAATRKRQDALNAEPEEDA